MEVRDFYDKVSKGYLDMVGGESKINAAVEVWRPIINGLAPDSVIDIGCGVGIDSLAIAMLGVKNVTGIDVSSSMIEECIANGSQVRVSNARFKVGNLLTLPELSLEPAALVICRGNTIPHLQSIDELRNAVKNIHAITKAGGLLILGWLNYIPIFRENRRLVGVTGSEKTPKVRFYDFNDDGSVSFNILGLNRSSNKWEGDIVTTRLMPWGPDDVGMLLVQNGWEELELTSSLNRDDFDPDSSTDAIYFAVRN